MFPLLENTYGPYNIPPIPSWWKHWHVQQYLNDEAQLYQDSWFDDRGNEFADLLSIRSACFRGYYVPVGAWGAAVLNYEKMYFEEDE